MADQAKKAAAYASWANTVDRSARTQNARSKSPGSLDHWLNKLGPAFDHATEAQRRDAAIAARKAHFARLAAASVKARRQSRPSAPESHAGSQPGQPAA